MNYTNLNVKFIFFFLRFFRTFFWRCFERIQRETFRNFPVTRFMEEMLYVFLFTFFSLPLTFTFSWWQLAFSLFLTAAINVFLFFFQRN